MKKITLSLVLFGLALVNHARQSGIQFREFENWQAVLDAASSENKPIFVDVFTTWCGPCKLMDKDVYPDSTVGAYFNRNFIAVKVQMDKTKKDNRQVKQWYPDITELEKKYQITGYPTFLFLTSSGEVLNRYSGYQNPDQFIATASIALKPGQKYLDPMSEYYDLIQLKLGNGKGLDLVQMANKLVNEDTNYFEFKSQVVDTLTRASLEYIKSQPSSSLFTKEVLEFIGRVGLKSTDSPRFGLFYPNTARADKLVGIKNFARFVIDLTIQKEFFSKNGADIDSVEKIVTRKFGKEYGTRAAEIQKLARLHSIETSRQFIESYLPFYEKHGIFYSQIIFHVVGLYNVRNAGNLVKLSELAIDLFCEAYLFPFSSDRHQIRRGQQLLKPVVESAEKKGSWWFADAADTYAHFLYVIGDRNLAINYQKKAIQFSKSRNQPASNIQDYQRILTTLEGGTLVWPLNGKENEKK